MLAGSAVNHREITLLIMEFGSCLQHVDRIGKGYGNATKRGMKQ